MFFSALKGLKIKCSLISEQTILANPAVLCCIDERCLLKYLQHLGVDAWPPAVHCAFFHPLLDPVAIFRTVEESAECSREGQQSHIC